MSTHSTSRLVAALAVALTLVTACSGSTPKHDAADVTFAQSMVPHHRQAVEMAAMAATQASSPAVKQVAAQIESAQEPEISTMTHWLKDWGKAVGSNEMNPMPGMMSGSDMVTLSSLRGPAFDRSFLAMMEAHHTGALQMARTELAQGDYPPAKQLARSIVATQTAEIAAMQRLLARA